MGSWMAAAAAMTGGVGRQVWNEAAASHISVTPAEAGAQMRSPPAQRR